MRQIFTALFVCTLAVLAVILPAQAGSKRECVGEACKVLHQGHVRGRLPLACISIPYIKEKYGHVAIFVLRAFDLDKANESDEGFQRQLDGALHYDSKVTGRVDDFCLNAGFFRGGNWVILCDEHHWGAIAGEPLQYALMHGQPPGNKRVRIGTHV